MLFNFKILFKYIFNKNLVLFFKFNSKFRKDIALTIPNTYLYYINLHFRLSTCFYSIQLIDIFAYEVPNLYFNSAKVTQILALTYHIVNFQKRLFLFVPNIHNFLNQEQIYINKFAGFTSISELFYNASWLEREASELSGVFYLAKKDMRNLMLIYGDSSMPFQKNYPTIGMREIFYDLTNDILVQQPTTLQF